MKKRSILGRIVRVLFCLMIFAEVGFQQSFADQDGKVLFEQKCVACHTIGEGKKVGPDLKGITEKRDSVWLKEFILSPSAYFERKDATAVALLKEYAVPMPDLGLKQDEVEAIVAYFRGDEAQVEKETKTPDEYLLTLIISGGVLIAITLVGFMVGRKKVEIR